MEPKRLIAVVLLSMGLMFLWMFGVSWLGERLGYDMTARPEAEVATDEPAAAVADPATATTAPVDATALRVVSEGDRRNIILGSAEPEHPDFPLEITLSSVGAGVERVVLNEFQARVDSDERYVFERPYEDAERAFRPLATKSVEVAGETVDLGDAVWSIDDAGTNETQALFYVDIGNADGVVARVEKLFRIYPRMREVEGERVADPRGGYEILVRETIRNRAGAPIAVQTVLNGPTSPPRELDYGYDRLIAAGYRGRNGNVDYEAFQVESFDEDEPQVNLVEQAAEPLLWAGAGTIYFNALVRPVPLQKAEGGEVPAPDYIQNVVAEAINPDSDPAERHVALRFVTDELTVPAGGDVQLPFLVYFGPKSREVLNNDYYSAAGVRYDETLVSPFGCTWCVFEPVVNVLVWMLSGFYMILRDWGLAIIALVVVVRLALHPITKRSQRSMMRMAQFGPELEKLKKKYGDDKEQMAKAMQEFYREHGMAALPLGCLPMLLQTPIWIALYSTLQAELRLRHAGFLEFGNVHLTWIDDLSQPDKLIEFGQAIPLFFFSIDAINLLPVLLAVVFYFQMKFQPQPQAATPEQQTQQAIMKWMMVFLFPVFLYKAPSGLNLYIITSTLIGIWESKRVRAQFKAEEAAKAAEQPTLVKDKAPRTAREKNRAKKGRPAERDAKPVTGWRAKFAQFQENLHKQIEQAQKDASKRSSERKR